jgi:Family of unknown function (DUF6445)/2OG-Fe(II) oxygenase superfamily
LDGAYCDVKLSVDVKPFIFDQIFRLNQNLTPPTRTGVSEVPVLVFDDVLQDPQDARAMVGTAPATNWGYPPGTRNFVDYRDCRLRFPVFPPCGLIGLAQQAIQAQFQVQTDPQESSIDVNWFMQIRNKPANHACPHQDSLVPGKRTFTCLLYLNSPSECSGGTAFFRFRKTQSLTPDTGFETAIKLDARLQENALDYWPRDPHVYWDQLGSIGMAPGRMVIFPAQYFHAAFHPEDSFFDFPRLTLVFWMVG